MGLKNVFRPLYYFFLDNWYSAKALLGQGVTPDFIIIGSQKGGTTSLYHYLSQHTKVVGASKKEVHYFDHNYNRGLGWYKAHFVNAAKLKKSDPSILAVEGSPYYVYHPHVPARIAKDLPDVKLILVVRKPSARAKSHYKHNVSRGKYPKALSFEEVLKIEEEQLAGEKVRLEKEPFYRSNVHDVFSLKDRGVYVEQIKRYYQQFDKKQLLIITAENLFKKPKQEMKKVCDFLGIENIEFSTDKVYNQNTITVTVEKSSLEALDSYYEVHNQALYELLEEDFNW